MLWQPQWICLKGKFIHHAPIYTHTTFDLHTPEYNALTFPHIAHSTPRQAQQAAPFDMIISSEIYLKSMPDTQEVYSLGANGRDQDVPHPFYTIIILQNEALFFCDLCSVFIFCYCPFKRIAKKTFRILQERIGWHLVQLQLSDVFVMNA